MLARPTSLRQLPLSLHLPMSARSNPRHPARSALPADSLAHSLYHAATLVAAVRAGRNLSEAMAELWASRAEWTPAQRGAIQDISYTCLRDYGRVPQRLARVLAKPAPEPIHSLLLVAVSRLAEEPGAAHTVVDQAVRAAEASAPGLKALVNGVLRSLLRQPPLAPAGDEARHRHPNWWVTSLRRALPQDWERVLEAGNQHPPMSLRVNRRRQSVEAALSALEATGLAARCVPPGALVLARPVPVQRLPGFAGGVLSVQDAGAQHAAEWLDLAAGQRVLDACAAPGGKAAQILEACDVELLALELDARRAERIAENFQRLGLAGHIAVADCTDLATWWDGRPFDRILADVPCSASGVVRRHPDIKWLRRAEDIPRFAAQQARILEALWQTLLPGGKMLYVTCSVFPEENQAQIAAFLARHGDARALPIEGQPEQQLLPDADHDGFYYALLSKQA
jgi:16S rRNA (cytosine967-C5)-methyltransferase